FFCPGGRGGRRPLKIRMALPRSRFVPRVFRQGQILSLCQVVTLSVDPNHSAVKLSILCGDCLQPCWPRDAAFVPEVLCCGMRGMLPIRREQVELVKNCA